MGASRVQSFRAFRKVSKRFGGVYGTCVRKRKRSFLCGVGAERHGYGTRAQNGRSFVRSRSAVLRTRERYAYGYARIEQCVFGACKRRNDCRIARKMRDVRNGCGGRIRLRRRDALANRNKHACAANRVHVLCAERRNVCRIGRRGANGKRHVQNHR